MSTTDKMLGGADVGPTMVFVPNTALATGCTVSETDVQVGESVTIDAPQSDNIDEYQYDKYGDGTFGEYTSQSTRVVSYSEPGTYDPQVKVWSYSDGENSDTAACGTVSVTESTSTPTPTPTSTADASCTVSETSVQVGESVTIDASGSENADSFQYDKYGTSSFGEYTSQSTRVVSYSEPGTYDPQVKVWSYSGGETSDTAVCGTVSVTESTPTPTPTQTATPTPTSTVVASCTVSETSVEVGESVTIDASGSENADDYQYDEFGTGSFGERTALRSRVVSYAEPGTYDPQVKVWSYSGGETSDLAACGTVSVTESTPTPTPTLTPTPTQTATSTQVEPETPIPSTETSVPTAATTTTSAPAMATATNGGVWFQYSPSDPSANDSVRLVSQPGVSQASAEAHGWDVDGDGTVDRRGRMVELPAKPSGETAVTLSIERANGSTASVTRVVPATLILANETATPDESGTPATGTGGEVPAAALVALLLVVLVVVLAVRSRMDR